MAADIDAAQRRQATKDDEAMQGGRYPIRNKVDLAHAIRAVGRTKPGDRPAVRRFIIKRAKALGASYPSTWAADGTVNGSSKN